MASFCLAHLFVKWFYFCQNSLNLGFLVKTSSDDGVGHPWQRLFFLKKHVPFQKNTHIAVSGYFLLKIENLSVKYSKYTAGEIFDFLIKSVVVTTIFSQ